MSEHADKHRRANKAKAKRLANEHEGKVDASSYGPPSQELFGQQTYVHKPKARAFKHGGKVMGEEAKHHAGRKPRCSGGFAEGGPAARIGNRAPEGIGPVGVSSRHPGINLPLPRKAGGRANFIGHAIKHPGALHEELHVPKGEKIPERKLEKAEHSSNPKERKRAQFAEELKGFRHKRADGGEVPQTRFNFAPVEAGEMAKAGGLKSGGRAERKAGGRAKGKTNINIVIAQHPPGGQAQAPGMGEPPPAPKPAGMPMPMPAAQSPTIGAPAPPMPPAGGGGGGQGFAGPMPRS